MRTTMLAIFRRDTDRMIGERIDPALLLKVFGQRQECRGIGRVEACLHSLAKRQRELPSRTTIRSARADRGSLQAVREGHMELSVHVGPGRQTGYRAIDEVASMPKTLKQIEHSG